MKENTIYGYKLASIGKRLIASLIEAIIFLLPQMLIYYMLGISDYWSRDFELSDIIHSAFSGILVGIIFYPIYSGNLGHRIFNLKVISSENGEDFKKPKNGAIRELLKNVLSFLIIPVIWILWDDKNQNLYDKISKTYVVRRND